MIIDHICIAVKDLNEGLEFWIKTFSYSQYTKPIVNTRQKVKVVFLKKNNSLTIKLIEPLENNYTLKTFVERGGGFHHICFKTDNVKEKVQILKDKGLRLLTPPQPGEAFNDNLIAFLTARNNLNIELIDTEDKVPII